MLQLLDAVGHDALPLTQKWPLLAFLLLLNRSWIDGLLSIKRGDHETASRVLKEVDGDRWRIHGCGFDRCDLESHGEQLDSRLRHGLGRVEVESVASNAQAERILLRLGVDLGDVERLRGDRESRWVELNAIDFK